MSGYIYILASPKNSTLYIWVTFHLIKRISEHKEKIHQNSFTAKYHCQKLVYFEKYENISTAIQREKQLKNWHRDWKNNLISESNPDWKDLSDEIF